MSGGEAVLPFMVRGDETIEQFLEASADTFRTVCQVALQQSKTINSANLKCYYTEVTEAFKHKLTEKAYLENKEHLLSDFIQEFLISPDKETSDDDSVDIGDAEPDDSVDIGDTEPSDSLAACGENIYEIGNHKTRDSEMQSVIHDKLNIDDLDCPTIEWLSIPAAAVKEKQLDIIQLCIKTGWSLALFRDLKDRTLLSVALSESSACPEMVSLLLRHIDVNLPGDRGETPLHACMLNQSLSGKDKATFLQLLVANGADCKKMAEPMGSPLHSYLHTLQFIHSTQKTHQARFIIDNMIQNGSDLNSVDWFGQSCLANVISGIPNIDGPFVEADSEEEALCARKTKVEIVEYILQKGADPNKKDKSGCTSLHIAMTTQNPDVVELLVRYGADVNALSNTKASPIYYFTNQIEWEDEQSIQEVYLPMIKILHNAKADLNIKAVDGSTVLHFAAARLNQTICSFMINLGAKLDVRDYLMRSPLHMASRNKLHPNVIETLVMSGASTDALDVNKATPLHTACLFGNSEAVRILLEQKASIASADDLGIQPIHLAAENGDEQMLDYLISYGADIHSEDQWKATPLHYSASDGNSESTKYLLGRGADKNMKDKHERSPLDFAKYRGHFEVATLLADDPHDVKFANFPPHLFPNRKLVKQPDVDEYFEEIAGKIKCMGSGTAQIAEAILSAPGVGRVNLHERENKQIFETVYQLAKDIADRIGELDPIFQCTLLKAGSTAEGVKIGYPDEYDFVCNLEKFSSLIQKVEKDATPVYAKVILQTPVPERCSKFCIRTSCHLNAAVILRTFHRLARQAMFDVLTRGYKSIYAGLLLLHHHESMFNEADISLSKLQGFGFSWRGCDHKLLDISIDLNPVVFTSHWPEQSTLHSSLLGDISKYGMFLIPKQCKTTVLAFPDQMSTESSDLWRYSTHHIESAAMSSLSQKARDSYMLCKAFRMEPLTCAVEIEPVMYAFPDEYENCSSEASDASVSSSKSEISAQTFQIHVEKGKPQTATVEIDLMKEQDDVFEENVFYEDENEVTAESSIPSYYLKTIFLTELEEFLKTTKEIPDDIWYILKSVYERLFQAVETEHLEAPFFPSQEIYSNASHANQKAAKEIRQTFCRNILGLIKSIEQQIRGD